MATITIPQWQTPRLSYDPQMGVTDIDFERIEGNILNLRNTGHPFGAATGVNNSYAINIVDVYNYAEFLSLIVKFDVSNTGPATLNLNSLGNIPIVREDGTMLAPNDIQANQMYVLMYGNSKFQILGRIAPRTLYGVANAAVDNEYTATVDAVNKLSNGTTIAVKFTRDNTGAATINVNSLGSKQLLKNTGEPLGPKDIISGLLVPILYDETLSAWRLVGRLSNTLQYGEASASEGLNYQALVEGVSVFKTGTQITIKFKNVNQANATLKVNDLAAIPIRTSTGDLVQAQSIQNNQILSLIYTGTSWQIVSPLQFIPVQSADEIYKQMPHVVAIDSTDGLSYVGNIVGLDVQEGARVAMFFNTANRGPCVVDINANGGKPLKFNLYELREGDIAANDFIETVLYNGTWRIIAMPDYTYKRISATNSQLATLGSDVIDIKLKLEEQGVIDFVNRSGYGYYDLFKDKTGIDEPNTTATIDTVNHKIVFPTVDKYTVKSVGAFTDVAEIKVDKEVNVKDRVNNIEVLNKTAVEEIGTHDVIDATVVNSAYDTSGNGGRKLVRLSNGWLVCAVSTGIGGNTVWLYISKNGGLNWDRLCFITANGQYGFSICNSGNIIYIIGCGDATNLLLYKIDATSVSDVQTSYISIIDSSQTVIGNCSLTINPQGTELHACWSSKNSTYPNSFNIRYAKGTISTDGSVTLGVVEQVSYINSGSSNYAQQPTIILDKNNIPHIICSVNLGANIVADFSKSLPDKKVTTNANWNNIAIFNGSSYLQDCPSAIFVPQSINGLANGRIWVTWQGKDATDTTYHNVRVSYSDDGGITWSTMQKLTSGNVGDKYDVSLTANNLNEVFLVYGHQTSNGVPTNVYYFKYIDSWGSSIELATADTNAKFRPSTLLDYSLSFSVPLIIYMHANTKVGFYGTWTDTITNYNLSLASTITTTDKQELTVQPYKIKNLKMLPQTFDNFDNINLALYPTKINKTTIKETVNNSTTVITGATDKELTVGDKLFMNGVLNEVLTSTGNYVNNDVQDATVVNSAYDTSGNGGRKLIAFNDEILFAVSKYSTGFIVSKYENNTWSTFKDYPGYTSVQDVCLVKVSQHQIGILVALNDSNVMFFIRDVNGDATYNFNSQPEANQTFLRGCSIVSNPAGTELHACWTSKNSTYPNSFNIRYAKGTINVDGSVSWGAVEQRTSLNTTGSNCQNPTITMKADGNPIIIYERSDLGICYYRKDASGWTYNGTGSSGYGGQLYNGGTYAQSYPSAIYVPQSINGLANGRIWVTWQGKDATDTTASNIRVSYSDDNGVSWSSMRKLTSGNVKNQLSPSITVNKNNEVFIMWSGANSLDDYLDIRMIKNSNGTWSEITDIIQGTTAYLYYPSTLYDLSLDFSKPLFIYKNTQSSKIGFYGTWTIGEGYILTMKNPTTLADGQQVPIVDLEAKQATTDMTLKEIDAEKFVYESSNLNTTAADITVLGSATELNTMAYAIS